MAPGCRAGASGSPAWVSSWMGWGGKRNTDPAANAVCGRARSERRLMAGPDGDRRQAKLLVGSHDDAQDRREPRPRTALQEDEVAERLHDRLARAATGRPLQGQADRAIARQL